MKCVYCEGEHPPMTTEEVAEAERMVLSENAPDLDEIAHTIVKLVAEVRRLHTFQQG